MTPTLKSVEPTPSQTTSAADSETARPNTSPVDFVIVTALEEERDAVLNKLPGYQRLGPFDDDVRVYFSSDLPVSFPDGSTGSYHVVVMPLLDMGRVQATVATTDAIRQWRPRYVLLVGIAGGIAARGVTLGDVLVSDQIVDYELQKLTSKGLQMRWKVYQVDPRLIGNARNLADDSWQKLITIERPGDGVPIRHIGPIASGDKVIAVEEALAKHRDVWPTLVGIEMEAGGVAVASFQAPKPPGFFMIRCVSDLANEEKDAAHVERWRLYACDVAASYAVALLKSGPAVPAGPRLVEKQRPIRLRVKQASDVVQEESQTVTEPDVTSVMGKMPTTPQLYIEPPYGTMRPDSKFYIERAADNECWEYISKTEAMTLFIQAPRQTGKSSLMFKIIDRAEKQLNRSYVFIDFQKFPAQYFVEEKDFLIELCLMIGDTLGLPEAIDKYWRGRRSNIIKCSRYVSDYIIPKIDEAFILAMDELERMLTSPFREDFFGMMRTWHNDRVHDENFRKMTLFLSSSTEPYLFVDNLNQSPFNVAEFVFLKDFTIKEVSELNELHGSPLTPIQINNLMSLIEGHPYLTRRALYLLATRKVDWETLLNQATKDMGPFGDHLRYYLLRVLQKSELKQALTHICRHHTYEENQIFHRLKGAGLIRRIGQQVVLRNKLYACYFEERLNC